MKQTDFFDFGGTAYLNCAYCGPLPRVAVEAAHAAVELETQPYRITSELFFSLPDDYRRHAAQLIGAEASDVAN